MDPLPTMGYMIIIQYIQLDNTGVIQPQTAPRVLMVYAMCCRPGDARRDETSVAHDETSVAHDETSVTHVAPPRQRQIVKWNDRTK